MTKAPITFNTDIEVRVALANAKKRKLAMWAKEEGTKRGKGALELRASAEGKGRWYWRYTLPDRSTTRIPLGVYGDRNGELTLKGARKERDDKVALYMKPESRDVRTFEAEQEQQRREAVEQAARDRVAKLEAKRERLTLTVDLLFAEYVTHLEAAGKALSARDAGNMFKNHVGEAFPEIAALPASDLTPAHVVEILRRLIDLKKPTTARKLRSYLRAAYRLAADAAHDPNSRAQMDRFGIKDNPVTAVKTVTGGNVSGEHTLNERELKAYMAWLEGNRSQNTDALILALYLGGQRMSQLLRVRVSDIDSGEQTIQLEDGKGRRSKPRKHLVPYGTRARLLIDELLASCVDRKSEYLFVTDTDSVQSKLTATSKQVNLACSEIADDPAAHGLDTFKPFRMGDIRRTCETMLAPIVSKDIRAQLLSHGISGVQTTNYDKYDYIDEKRAAINLWELKLADIVKGKFKVAATKPKVAALVKRQSKSA